MEKSVKDGKPWNYGLLEYRVTPIWGNLPSPLEALTGCRPKTSLPQIPSSVGKSVENSRIHQELVKRQPSTCTHYSMEFEPGQPVFVKEVNGNVWKSGVIRPTSKGTWIILGLTFKIIPYWEGQDPWSNPDLNLLISGLETKGKEWTSTGIIPPHSHQLFNSMLPALEIPALPMDNLVPPPLTTKATPLSI